MRQTGWEKKFLEFIASRQRTPFAWGKNDCCLFACDCVQAITGVDHSTSFRGKYTDEVGACRLVKESGGIRAIADKALGAEIKPNMAQRGDVILLETPRETLGICVGLKIAAPGPNGLVFVPLWQAVAAWRVK